MTLALNNHPATRLDAFLIGLRSRGKLDYKRYLGSPLRYAGGKSLGVGYVLERLPGNIERLVSPFMGGGSVEIACAREIGVRVMGYDVFDVLVNYWQAQLNDAEALYGLLADFEPTRDTFWQVKRRLEWHWRGEECLPYLDLAAHYYFNSNTSYGPHFLGWPSDIYLQKSRYAGMIAKLGHFAPPVCRWSARVLRILFPNTRGIFCTAIPRIIWRMGRLLRGCIRIAIFRCITSALTMRGCGICCLTGGAVSYFPITIAKPSGNGTGTAGCSILSGSILLGRATPGSAATAPSLTAILMLKDLTNC